jgi:hypothetical protein
LHYRCQRILERPIRWIYLQAKRRKRKFKREVLRHLRKVGAGRGATLRVNLIIGMLAQGRMVPDRGAAPAVRMMTMLE